MASITRNSAVTDSHASSSSDSSDNEVASPSSRPTARRESSIRFSRDTKTTSHSPMAPRGQSQASLDEVTPIRQDDGHARRNYNTSEAHAPPTVDSSGDSSGNPKNEKNPAWYKQMAEKYGSISLENKGSVARDHLALERTFLAWLRTSLAFASIGIAITQLFRLNTSIASKTKRYNSRSLQDPSDLPFSPLLGHSLPLEVLQALQSHAQNLQQSTPTLGPTLLDQLLLLPANSDAQLLANPFALNAFELDTLAIDNDAAAKLRHIGKPLGATFLGISIIVLFVGFHRYFEAQHWIIRGKFPASRGSVALVGIIAGALIIASLVVVLVVAQSSYQK